MKGWELLKELAEGKIKEGIRVREEGGLKEYIYDKDTGDFIDKDTGEWYLTEQYNDLQFTTCNFELIEEQEEINIQDYDYLIEQRREKNEDTREESI